MTTLDEMLRLAGNYPKIRFAYNGADCRVSLSSKSSYFVSVERGGHRYTRSIQRDDPRAAGIYREAFGVWVIPALERMIDLL